MNPKSIMLCEISKKQKDKYCRISFIHGISKEELNEVENRFCFTVSGGGRMDKERGGVDQKR
jgi:hypothetical protein